MWNTYGWWPLATVAFFAGIALIVAGLALGLVSLPLRRRPQPVARPGTRAEVRA
jgi:hypothetical protein